MLAAPLNVPVLRALESGPRRQADLQYATTSAPTTLRAQLKRLHAAGALEKHRRNRFPGVLEYELTAAGHDLLGVAAALGHWLLAAPASPLEIGGNPARAAVKAFAGGWSSTILRALAAAPLSLTELDRVIAGLSYPSLERRLGALRVVGLIEARSAEGRSTPYAITDWMRRGLAPLAAAARWEQCHMRGSRPPLGRIDLETMFLMAAPLLRTPDRLRGSCRLVAEMTDERRELAGVVLTVEGGRVTAYTTALAGTHAAGALGSVAVWLGALVDGDVEELELSGDRHLARAVLRSLHAALFESNLTVALDANASIEEDGSK